MFIIGIMDQNKTKKTITKTAIKILVFFMHIRTMFLWFIYKLLLKNLRNKLYENTCCIVFVLFAFQLL